MPPLWTHERRPAKFTDGPDDDRRIEGVDHFGRRTLQFDRHQFPAAYVCVIEIREDGSGKVD